MSETITTPAITAPVVVKGAPDGILRVFVPGELDSHAARSTACKAHGGVTVGRTPLGKSGTLHGVKGHVYDFAPVAKRQAGKPSVATVKATGKPSAPVANPVELLTLALQGDTVSAERLLALLAGGTVKATSTSAPVKAPRAVPDFIVKAAAKRAAIACKRCSDYGVVPSVGPRWEAGKPFKTANGAATSPNSVPCPSHVKAAKRGKAKRSA